MRYEIEENTNAVRIWQDGEELPCLFQPDFPDNTPFADATEAEKYAIAVVAHYTNSQSNAFPLTRDDLK